jgi:acyl-CoA dehydrogenase
VLGGSLKRRERLSARLGDILSLLYLASAALKRYHDQGCPQDDLPLLHWSLQDALQRMEDAFYGLFQNLPGRFIGGALKRVIFPYGREFPPPRDGLGHEVVNLLLAPGPARERLTAGVYISRDADDPVGALEAALRAVIAAEETEARIRSAHKAGVIAGRFMDELLAGALEKGVVSRAEADALERARQLRRKVVMVDDFPQDFGRTEIYQTTRPVTFEALRKHPQPEGCKNQ